MKKLILAISAAALVVTASYAAFAADTDGHRMMGAMADKTVTRAEASTHASAMFDKLDINRDGKIDPADRTARQIERFRKIDTDGNGSISQDEFLAAHARKSGERGMGRARDGGAMNERGMKRRGMMGHAGGREMPMVGMVMLRMADTNRDSAVSREEFVAAAMGHFDQADSNHDGKLTPDERRAAMQAMHAKMKSMRAMGGMQHGTGEGPMPSPSGN